MIADGSPPLLIGSLGCGSAIVELGYAMAGLPLTLEDVPYLEQGAARDRLLALNPLGQVPTLVLPDGTVMTESAAIMLHLHDRAPDAGLLPPAGAPDRALALNLLLLLVASIYPTFSYGDRPQVWVGDGPAAERLRQQTGTRREALWRQLDRMVTGPFMLGTTPCALDLYVSVMRWWEPGLAWFATEAPRIAAAAEATRHLPQLGAVFRRHQPALAGTNAASP